MSARPSADQAIDGKPYHQFQVYAEERSGADLGRLTAAGRRAPRRPSGRRRARTRRPRWLRSAGSMLASGMMQLPEPHLRGFAHAQRGLGDAADLARQADLAEHRRGRRNHAVPDARRDGGEHAQIRGRLVDRHPSRDVHEHVVAHEIETGALLEHREQQRQPLLIDAAGHPARGAVGARADQRLDFDENRPRALDRAEHRRTGRVDRALGEKQLRGVRAPARRPADVISKTPSSLTAPKRFLTARTTRCE